MNTDGRRKVLGMAIGASEAERFWTVLRDNVSARGEMAAWWQVMSEGARPDIGPEDAAFVRQALDLLPDAPWSEATWGAWTAAVKDATGRKGAALFKPLRRAMTGSDRGPDMAALMPLLKKRPHL